MEFKNEYKLKKKSNRIDCGKLGVGLIGTCLFAPYVFPTIGVVQTATLIPIISKGLVAFGATALSGITAYNALDLLFNTTEKDNNEKMLKSTKLEKVEKTALIKDKVSDKSVDDANNKESINKEKKGDFITC